MRARRWVAAVVAGALAVALSACAGLPTSGPVYPGQEAESTSAPADTIFLPERPQTGATPDEIVDGFLLAGSGPTDGWARAREYLAPDFATEWRPDVGVTVVVPGDRVYETDSAETDETTGEATVSVSVVAIAGVDDRGTYAPVDAGTTTLSFTLELQDDGEWRITDAPDGIVLDSDVFPSVYHRYSVFYFDPAWEYLVPDVRWFPATNAPTRITDALVNKPVADWLAEAVVTSFPEGVAARAAVPVESGVAQVELDDSALAIEPGTLDRMLTQLQASLATAGVSRVEMSVAQAPLEAERVETRSTRISGGPLVLTEDGFGALTGEELTPVEGLSDVVPDLDPTAVQVTAERELAVVRAGDGTVHRVGADGSDEVVDRRDRLVDPTIDPSGTVWSVPRSDPAAIIAVTTSGAREVANAFGGVAAVSAIAISRDGTRLAAAVQVGTRRELWIAGVARDAEGSPQALGDPVLLGVIAGPVSGIAWLDDVTVGVVSTAGDAGVVSEQIVGGPVSTTAAPVGVVDIAGGPSTATVRLRTEDGTLLVRRGANWQESATGVLVLATQQGSPG
ncbi:LpqB family beta-propeller domain-containing protein [Microbacterium thalassium]|uniref:GerMN domain-containing protein n=1 Tax=Microbacterium thalassium TaxID=362649 RepID=A0A7X0FPR9_9MICO|nr:LpqB family beta-propeller domain-containing protein [Microbacterium thalassium]MBB6391341.1 hypothetical protein [Microbacterium thalassium]GLK23362.1 lipoprotein LpqB [Microbacterium thalassium]